MKPKITRIILVNLLFSFFSKFHKYQTFIPQTSEGHLLFYNLEVSSDQKGVYAQTDSPHANLRRDSAELFIKETIPPLRISEVKLKNNTIFLLVLNIIFLE